MAVCRGRHVLALVSLADTLRPRAFVPGYDLRDMTLVVARRAGDALELASDLRVTDELDIRRGYPFGILKIVSLGPELAVAFAGGVDLALDALESVSATPGLDHDKVAAGLVPFSIRGTLPPDFIVASTNPVAISRVSAGAIEAGLHTAHIGDPAAFNRYQEIVAGGPALPPDLETHYTLAATMGPAMGTLVREGSSLTVGEASIGMRASADGFLRYVPGAVVQFVDQAIPSGEWTALRFGSAAEGGHAFSILVPLEPGIAAVGIHFRQGRLGLLYRPLADRFPFSYHPVDHDRFRAAVQAEHGFDIQGVLL